MKQHTFSNREWFGNNDITFPNYVLFQGNNQMVSLKTKVEDMEGRTSFPNIVKHLHFNFEVQLDLNAS